MIFRVACRRSRNSGTCPMWYERRATSVNREYFDAVIDKRDKLFFVDLPAADSDHGGVCGQLLRHMYGRRGADDKWQGGYSTMLVRRWFREGNACHGLVFFVHSDDFTAGGPRPQLDWFEMSFAKQYDIRVGPDSGRASSMPVKAGR